MTSNPDLLTAEFRALSARLGQDPLQVQGPGGNTSIKDDVVMWIKASGTELADAKTKDIFVAVDRAQAVAEANEEAGDGSCKATVLDPEVSLRPSIETTFHAALDHQVIVHTHSVATITHAISVEGRVAADHKLADLGAVRVPYAKPGLPLTREILRRITSDTRVIILQNHGLICAGNSADEVDVLIRDVEQRLALPTRETSMPANLPVAPDGFRWADESWMATDPNTRKTILAGTYYPDHAVFLGPALPVSDHDGQRPAVVVPDTGILVKKDATPAQLAMLRCLSDVLSRLPEGWSTDPIGQVAEAELLNWDAEKYRQALAART